MNASGLFKKLKEGLPIDSKWDLVVMIQRLEEVNNAQAKLIKELEMKVINLAFDLEYQKRSNEIAKEYIK